MQQYEVQMESDNGLILHEIDCECAAWNCCLESLVRSKDGVAKGSNNDESLVTGSWTISVGT